MTGGDRPVHGDVAQLVERYPEEVGVESSSLFITTLHSWRNWLAQVAHNDKVIGSSPLVCTMNF